MKFFHCYSLLLLITVGSQIDRVSAQSPTTTQGKEFYLVAMSNLGSDELNTFLYVYIAADTATTGTVDAPGIGFSQNFSVAAHSVTTVTVPAGIELQASEQIEKKAIHVTTDRVVSVFAMFNKTYSADAYLAYPVQSLGKEYYTLCYPSSAGGIYTGMETAGEFAILAAEDNTTVTITPTSSTQSGRNSTFSVLLPQKGDVVQVKGNAFDALNDLTGSHIVSDKPVAVFSGHRRANIITKLPARYTSRDHIVEQMPPVSTWGKKFPFVVPKARLDQYFNRDTIHYVVRIIAANNQTTIKMDNQTVATVNAGKFYEWLPTHSTVIESDKPILVGLYAPSCSYSSSLFADMGDPYLATITPSVQYVNAYTFTSVVSNLFSENFVSIIIPHDSLFQVLVDGVPVSPSLFLPVGQTLFSEATLPLQQGNHRLTSNSPFGITVYGYGPAISYGYCGGTGVKIVQELIPVTPSFSLCARPLALNLKTPGEIGDITLVIDSAQNIQKADELGVTVHYDPNLLRIVTQPQFQFGHVSGFSNDAVAGVITFTLTLDSIPINSQTLVATISAQALLAWYKEGTITVTTSHIHQGGKTITSASCAAPFALGEECILPSTLRARGSAEIVSIYPNPSASSARVTIRIHGSVTGDVGIYDVFGRKVESLFEGAMTEGEYDVPITTEKYMNGIYFCRLFCNGQIIAKEFCIDR